MSLRSATMVIVLAAVTFTSGCGRRRQPPPPANPARPMAQPQVKFPAGEPGRPITVRVLSRLGPGQIKETTTLTVNGVTRVIHLDLDTLPKTSVDFTLPGPGLLTYSATCQTTYKNMVRHGRGNGQLHIGNETTFELFMRDAVVDPFELFLQTHEQVGPLAQVTLAPDYRRVERERRRIDVAPGQPANVKVSRTVEHKVIFRQNGENIADSKLGIPLGVTATVKARLAEALNRAWANSTAVEEEVSLQGGKGRHFEVVWYDHIRTGAVTFSDNTGMNIVEVRREFEVTESTTFELRTVIE